MRYTGTCSSCSTRSELDFEYTVHQPIATAAITGDTLRRGGNALGMPSRYSYHSSELGVGVKG